MQVDKKTSVPPLESVSQAKAYGAWNEYLNQKLEQVFLLIMEHIQVLHRSDL